MDETKKGFMQNIGDLSFKKIDETIYEFSITVEEKFLNTGKIAHGGFIATIADTGMGNAAHIAAGNKRAVTINLDIKFISFLLLIFFNISFVLSNFSKLSL